MVEAVLRGRLKSQDRTGDRVVVGDRVRLLMPPDGYASIEEVAPRRSELARTAPGSGGRRAKIIVANLDQVVCVFAAAWPEPRLRMLDRLLVLAEGNRLPAVIVVNKVDLVALDSVQRTFQVYESIGYPVVYSSAARRTGLDDLLDVLRDQTSVFTGPSGVGKSTLLNAIEPGLRLRTAQVRPGGKGRHTTVNAELLPLKCGGYVADTPGLREVGLWGIATEDLDFCFLEFRPYLGACRFGGSCSHTHEPDCAVMDAVDSGEISENRYESYRLLRES